MNRRGPKFSRNFLAASAAFGLSSPKVLYDCLQVLKMQNRDKSDRLADKAAFKARIEALAEDGMIAMVESGRDCDGVQYSGQVSIVRATVANIERIWNETEKWADGPFYFDYMKPSEAKDVEYSSRDLTLEAFENGHAHVLYA